MCRYLKTVIVVVNPGYHLHVLSARQNDACQIGWDWLAPWLGPTVCQQLISSWRTVKRMCDIQSSIQDR